MEKLNLFLNNVPPAIYVLVGVVVSGVFNIVSSVLNNKNNENLKKIEIKNTKDKEIFLTKLQIFTEFLDKRAKLHRTSENIDNDGKYCISIVDVLYKVQLIIPEKNEEIDGIRVELIALANIYSRVDSRSSLKATEKKKAVELVEKLNNLTNYLPNAILK